MCHGMSHEMGHELFLVYSCDEDCTPQNCDPRLTRTTTRRKLIFTCGQRIRDRPRDAFDNVDEQRLEDGADQGCDHFADDQ